MRERGRGGVTGGGTPTEGARQSAEDANMATLTAKEAGALDWLQKRKAELDEAAARLLRAGASDAEVDRLLGWERGYIEGEIDCLEGRCPF
jgi:hypothetical protein